MSQISWQIQDEYSEFGEVANPKYINKKFVVEVTSEIIDMNGPEGEVVSQDTWVINNLKLSR